MDIYSQVEGFYRSYEGEKEIIGKSYLGRNIYAFFSGGGRVKGICQYAIHAREWRTALLGLEHIRYGVDGGGVWFIPLLNPDGALLCQRGISSVKDGQIKNRLLKINGSGDFSAWKANASCVDLNVNFSARWGTGKSNVFAEAAANYVGKSPFSEAESAALRDFTLRVQPNFTISYHSSGGEVYWYFNQPVSAGIRDKKIASALSKSCGYPLKYTFGSAGGYKDWCIEKLKIPAFTVEIEDGDIKKAISNNLLSVNAVIRAALQA